MFAVSAPSPYLPSTPGGQPMTPGLASYLPGTPGGQPMTPGTGILDAMSPVIGMIFKSFTLLISQLKPSAPFLVDSVIYIFILQF